MEQTQKPLSEQHELSPESLQVAAGSHGKYRLNPLWALSPAPSAEFICQF